MKASKKYILVLLTILLLVSSCNMHNEVKKRGLVDTVGFAHTPEQLDSILSRTYRAFPDKQATENTWKVAISPHDDHAYVSYLYPQVLKGIKAKTVIIFGVAHKAWKLHLQDKLIFGTFDKWKSANGLITISPLRDEIIKNLPKDFYIINDTMMAIEHSIEAILPYLQKFNKDVEIVPILVPYMSYSRMEEIAKSLAKAIDKSTSKRKMKWGEDYAILISTDAVHYGDHGWGGSNLAPYGADSAGYQKAVKHEYEIINNSLVGQVTPQKVRQFTQYTVQDTNYKEYKWTWCGRYSVPFGLLTAYYIAQNQKTNLNGQLIGYATSIDHPKLRVEDLGLGTTAPANIHHWVGYAALGYK